MSTQQVEEVRLQQQPATVVRGHVAEEALPEFLGAAFEETLAAISRQGHTPAGPPFACYLMTDTGVDVEAGFPVTGPVTAAGRVVPTERVLHRGPHAGVAEAYARGERWLAEPGRRAAADRRPPARPDRVSRTARRPGTSADARALPTVVGRARASAGEVPVGRRSPRPGPPTHRGPVLSEGRAAVLSQPDVHPKGFEPLTF
ncbi:hypothetical protein ACI784_07285 [Geodermatophilus sp. SYSU D01186]